MYILPLNNVLNWHRKEVASAVIVWIAAHEMTSSYLGKC